LKGCAKVWLDLIFDFFTSKVLMELSAANPLFGAKAGLWNIMGWLGVPPHAWSFCLMFVEEGVDGQARIGLGNFND
jgi:hypothetical protein